MSIQALDNRFLDIVTEDQSVDLIQGGFGFTEGPVWHPVEHHLTFSDIPHSKLYRWSENSGVSIYRDPSNMANGNTYDKQGRILTCEHASSQVRREEQGKLEVIASHFEGRELNSPNDIVARSDGMIFFTDPSYGRDSEFGIKRERELEFQGLYQLDPGTLELTLLEKDFVTPNGLCFGLDESVLFVADTEENHIRRFRIENKSLSGGEVFATSPWPDGLKIDALGNLYAGGPDGVYIYHCEGGEFLGVVRTPEFCANFTWGGPDLSTLFLTASSGLFAVRVNVSGIPLF